MVNLDIVSGFLGSGKTTFIQQLLKHFMDKGEKTVYVVNEFGEVGVDSLIMKNEGCEVFELANGCICCTLKADFALILKDLLDNVNPDRIVFEPSGVFVFADFFSFLRGDWIRERCHVSHVVTIVDAVTFSEAYSSMSHIMEDQIRNAGTVIVSKTQLPNARTEETVCDVRNISQNVNIISMDWNSFTPELLDKALEAWPVREHKHNVDLSDECCCTSAKSVVLNKAAEHMEFETASLKLEPFGTYDELVAFTRKIREGRFGGVLRGKGFMRHGGETYLVNIVGGECDIVPYTNNPGSSFTIIGTGLSI